MLMRFFEFALTELRSEARGGATWWTFSGIDFLIRLNCIRKIFGSEFGLRNCNAYDSVKIQILSMPYWYPNCVILPFLGVQVPCFRMESITWLRRITYTRKSPFKYVIRNRENVLQRLALEILLFWWNYFKFWNCLFLGSFKAKLSASISLMLYNERVIKVWTYCRVFELL